MALLSVVAVFFALRCAGVLLVVALVLVGESYQDRSSRREALRARESLRDGRGAPGPRVRLSARLVAVLVATLVRGVDKG